MKLFGFGKKKKVEKKLSACCTCGGSEEALRSGDQSGSPLGEITSIKVLGGGCKSCKEQYEHVKTAVRNLELSVEVEYITDMEQVMSYGVMRMPLIVVDEQVVSAGQVLKAAQVEKLLRK